MGHLPGGYTDPFMNDISIIKNVVSESSPLQNPPGEKNWTKNLANLPVTNTGDHPFRAPSKRVHLGSFSIPKKVKIAIKNCTRTMGNPRESFIFWGVISPIFFEGWKKPYIFPWWGSKAQETSGCFCVGFAADPLFRWRELPNKKPVNALETCDAA